MERVQDYWRHAAECLLLAEEVTDARSKARLLAMAQAWVRLTELAEKNRHTDIVYETPMPLARTSAGAVQFRSSRD